MQVISHRGPETTTDITPLPADVLESDATPQLDRRWRAVVSVLAEFRSVDGFAAFWAATLENHTVADGASRARELARLERAVWFRLARGLRLAYNPAFAAAQARPPQRPPIGTEPTWTTRRQRMAQAAAQAAQTAQAEQQPNEASS